MKNSNRNIIITTIATVLFMVFVAVIPDIIGMFTINDPIKELLALLLVLFLYGTIIALSIFVYNYFFQKQMNMYKFDVAYNTQNNSYICRYHNGYCCGNAIIDNLKETTDTIDLSLRDKSKYHLFNEIDINSKESKYFITKPNGQIWVVSFALETEIEYPLEGNETSLQKSMEIVKQNIKNGYKYTQFVALGKQQSGNKEFQERRKCYYKDLNKNEITNAPIIQIDDNTINDNMMFMVKLTSAVLFVDDEGTDGEADYSVEGYFCFRPDEKSTKDYEKRPVFFRMPNCMERQYFEFLRTKKINYFNNINTK